MHNALDHLSYVLAVSRIDLCCWCITISIRLADPKRCGVLVKPECQNVGNQLRGYYLQFAPDDETTGEICLPCSFSRIEGSKKLSLSHEKFRYFSLVVFMGHQFSVLNQSNVTSRLAD